MSQAQCTATLEQGGLTQEQTKKLAALPNINWSALWALIQKYGPLVKEALLIILPLLRAGTNWQDIEQAILQYILHKQPAP